MLRLGLAVLAYLALFGIWGMQLGESCLHLDPSFDTNVISQLSEEIVRRCRHTLHFVLLQNPPLLYNRTPI